MSQNTVNLNLVATVENIYQALKTSHHGFPVVNSSGRVVGLIPKNFLMILINKRAFYGSNNVCNATTNMNLSNSIKPHPVVQTNEDP